VIIVDLEVGEFVSNSCFDLEGLLQLLHWSSTEWRTL